MSGGGGVLGVLPGVVGSIQATEVVKLILGKGEILKGKLLIYDSLNMDFKKVKIHKNPNCPVCSDNATLSRNSSITKSFAMLTLGLNTICEIY